ncbi:peptidylprolyl isomerase [Halopseudomonas pelagia]|uniref:peptidylprolyl isomerase n=1 Tax=Halopseudomonas pelagia TaxID=553151 RepID=UPI00039F5069|nr:peptidylprolyl isomerase [Halopseudomonas pelagia]
MKKGTVFVGLGAGLLLVTVVSMAMGDKNPQTKKVEVDSAQLSGSVATIAQLGDQYIEADELQALLAGLPQGSADRLGQNRTAIDDWLRSRLAEKKLLSEAVAQGWDQREEIQQMARSATEQIVLRTYLDSVSQVPEDYPSEAELNAAYEINKGQWATPAMYQVSQIFLAVNDQGSLEDVRKRAVELTNAAREGQTDFAELARKNSEDPQSAQQGGDIGMRPLELLIPEIRPVLAQLEVGAVSDPVQTPTGLHVLKLTDMQPARVAALDQVREQLRNSLRSQRKELVAKAYMEGLVNAGTLSIDGAALNVVLEQTE